MFEKFKEFDCQQLQMRIPGKRKAQEATFFLVKYHTEFFLFVKELLFMNIILLIFLPAQEVYITGGHLFREKRDTNFPGTTPYRKHYIFQIIFSL